MVELDRLVGGRDDQWAELPTDAAQVPAQRSGWIEGFLAKQAIQRLSTVGMTSRRQIRQNRPRFAVECRIDIPIAGSHLERS